jgi:hypothetical protein
LTLLAALLAWKTVPATKAAQTVGKERTPVPAPLICLIAIVFITGRDGHDG